jgi:cytochrome P450
MRSLAEDLAETLAKDVLEAAEIMGDEDLSREIATLIGSSSQTYEEAFLTAIRVLNANKQARALLTEKLQAFEAKLKAGET